MTTEKNGKPKAFDCVEMKRRGAEAVERELRGLTAEERLGYWRKKTEDLRRMVAGRKEE